MKVTFILPSVSKKEKKKYMKTWQMEPLAIGRLASLTPKDVEIEFFDDRVESINYDTKTDLVGINIETYTARRAYEIIEKFRQKGIPVIAGGFHVTLCPEDVIDKTDSILIGEAENLWSDVLDDLKHKSLKKIYKSDKKPELTNLQPDRSIYKNKGYLKLGLVETGRGCKFNCDFCSITNFYRHSYRYRPIKDVIDEIKSLSYKYYFFVDDNICADFEHAKKLFSALAPLKIRWLSQASINIAKDEELLKQMKKSGCEGVLIGFESLNKDVLKKMNKTTNMQFEEYSEAIKKINSYGIKIYGTFVFGYENNDAEIFQRTYDFAMKHKLFLAAFNHLVPFPGTPLYNKMKERGLLLNEKWWLDPNYYFGDVAFKPNDMSPENLSNLCYKYRQKFYSRSSLLKRLFNFSTNFKSFKGPYVFLVVNFLSRIDVKKRQGLPLGMVKK